jgi:hypothetical protein
VGRCRAWLWPGLRLWVWLWVRLRLWWLGLGLGLGLWLGPREKGAEALEEGCEILWMGRLWGHVGGL